jgi:hypothetical protein
MGKMRYSRTTSKKGIYEVYNMYDYSIITGTSSSHIDCLKMGDTTMVAGDRFTNGPASLFGKAAEFLNGKPPTSVAVQVAECDRNWQMRMGHGNVHMASINGGSHKSSSYY